MRNEGIKDLEVPDLQRGIVEYYYSINTILNYNVKTLILLINKCTNNHINLILYYYQISFSSPEH